MFIKWKNSSNDNFAHSKIIIPNQKKKETASQAGTNLQNLGANRAALQKMFKEVLQREGKLFRLVS